MARASTWGLGTALAYRALPAEEQAELLALYVASRTREGQEAEGVLTSALSRIAAEVMGGQKNPPGKTAPGKVTQKITPMFPPNARPKLSPADLLRPPE